jgi:transposase
VRDVEHLLRENAAQRVENVTLRAQLAELVATNAKLTELVAKLTERIDELLAAVKRKGRRPGPETKPADVTPPPTLGDDQRRAFENRPAAPAKPIKDEPRRKRPPPTGRKPIPAHLEAEQHELRPASCASCGSTALELVDTLVEEKLHVVKEHVRRRVVTRSTCRCRACDARTTPRSLPAPYARSKMTCDFLAWLVHQKFGMLTPLDRVRRDLEERGVHLAMGSLVSFIERAADLLAPIDGLHWKQLLAGKWMATDGTGLKVLVPGLPAAHNGYLDIFRNDELAVFQYAADKSGDAVVAKLARFRGTLTADAEHRLNAVYASGAVIESGCNAHGRRKFRDAEATQPALAAEAGRFLGAMYGEEERARARGLRGDALLQHRRQHIRPIADAFDMWREAVEPSLLPSEPLAIAVRYYRHHRDALYRFLEDPDVPIDNSPTEREFQNVAKLRLNALFAGSTEGAHRAAVLLGIVATCRAIDVPVQAYLTWAFERLGTHRDVFALDLEAMTPAAFKRARSP